MAMRAAQPSGSSSGSPPSTGTVNRCHSKPPCTAVAWLRVRVAAEDDLLAVRRPVDDLIRIGMPGEPARLPALGGDDVDIAVAVVLARERNGFSVRREAREVLRAGVARQAPGAPAGIRDLPEIALGREHDRVLVEIGELVVARPRLRERRKCENC